ncbi:ATP-binding protein [Planctomycetota bacterium]
MPSRPFHRAFGETSLELKCLFLFGVFLLVVMTISFFLYWRVTQELVNEENPNTAGLLVDQAMLIKHFFEYQDKEDQDFREYLQDVTEDLREQKYEWRFIKRPDWILKPIEGVSPPADEFEEEVLRKYLRGRPPQTGEPNQTDQREYTERPDPDGDEYQYYQAIRVETKCLDCHRDAGTPSSGVFPVDPMMGGFTPISEGDLLAIVYVTFPNTRTRNMVTVYWNILLAVTIITAFLAMIAFYVTIRYVIVRPVRHLREVSDAISHGNVALRAEIRTGDEFEALGVAFNRMLRHLVTIQDELRQANINLDGKVDELAQVNMQLYEMNRVKSDFMATMSHELRTPLNSILGFSDLLGSIESLDEKQKRFVENVQKSGKLLLDLINNILDLAKIESGKMDVRLTDFDVAQLIGTQCDMARPLTERKNIDLDTEIEPNLPPMHQDQGRVHQILNNLLSNAIKFTPEGGRIQVAAAKGSAGELLLKVIDTGVGIAEEDQQPIFEKFRQGSTGMPSGDAITREYSGTGLGLSIVQELCKLLDGEVSVESALGTGSTFAVRLPWKLEKQPRLDSPLTAGLEDFAKPRLDPRRDAVAEPLSTTSIPRRPETSDENR